MVCDFIYNFLKICVDELQFVQQECERDVEFVENGKRAKMVKRQKKKRMQ